MRGMPARVETQRVRRDGVLPQHAEHGVAAAEVRAVLAPGADDEFRSGCSLDDRAIVSPPDRVFDNSQSTRVG